jgi:hypothetical protein
MSQTSLLWWSVLLVEETKDLPQVTDNISVIFWRLVLLVEETGVPGENDKSYWYVRTSESIVISLK